MVLWHSPHIFEISNRQPSKSQEQLLHSSNIARPPPFIAANRNYNLVMIQSWFDIFEVAYFAQPFFTNNKILSISASNFSNFFFYSRYLTWMSRYLYESTLTIGFIFQVMILANQYLRPRARISLNSRLFFFFQLVQVYWFSKNQKNINVSRLSLRCNPNPFFINWHQTSPKRQSYRVRLYPLDQMKLVRRI